MDQQNQAMQLMNCAVNGQSITMTSGAMNTNYLLQVGTSSAPVQTAQYTCNDTGYTLWGYWQGQYYPQVILQSYPVYLQDKAMDKGKHAFEIVKALMDKGLLKVDKVKDFIEAMDAVLKSL